MAAQPPPHAAADEAAEVAALDRILTRTVLTKDEDLQPLLAKLLPALVLKLATPQPKTRQKVLELLNHINKRVKALPQTALPLLPMVELAAAPASGPLVRSFALVYVELGCPRAPPAEQLAAVPLLLSGLAGRPAQHRAVALRVVAGALALLQPAPGGSYSQVAVPGSKAALDAAGLLPRDAADRALFLGHALKLLLYQRPSLSGGRALLATPLGLANAAAAAGGGAAGAAAAAAAAASAEPAQPGPPPPPGLSSADVAALEEKGVPSQEALTQQKLGLLALLAAAAAGMPGRSAAAAAAATAQPAPAEEGSSSGAAAMEVDGTQAAQAAAAAGPEQAAPPPPALLTSEELLLPLLAASCDPFEAVSRRGCDLLTKLVNPDAARPAVDLEQQAVVDALLSLLLGDLDPRAAAPAPTPAGPALAVRIMQLLVRSVAAARSFPAAALVMSACLSGPASSPRLVRLGAEWTGWVFKHAHSHQLKAMAGPVTAKLLSALGLADDDSAEPATQPEEPAAGAQPDEAQQGGGSSGGGSSGGLTLRQVAGARPSGLAALSGSSEARGYVYSALGQLANRLPELFQGDTELARRLFAALAAEPPGSRASLQEALAGLAGALASGLRAPADAAGGTAAGGATPQPEVSPDKLREIQALLLSSIASDQAPVRLCAAQWACRLFPRTHMPSRYVCLLAAGDAKPEVRDVGLGGLGLQPAQLPPGASPSAYREAVAGLGLPGPGAVCGYLAAQHKALATPGDLGRPLPLPDASCQAAVAFIRAAAVAAAAGGGASAAGAEAGSGTQAAYDPAGHALLLENLACRGAGRDTAAAALMGLVELAGGAEWMASREADAASLRARLATRQSWLLHWLGHNHLPVRLAAARLVALAASALEPAAADALLQQLLSNLSALPAAPAAAAGGGGAAAVTSSSTKLEEQEGALLAAGLLLARAADAGQPVLSHGQQQAAVDALHQQLAHHAGSEPGSGAGGRQPVLAGAAAAALGFCGLAGLALPGTAVPADAGAGTDGDGAVPPLLQLLLDLAGSKDSRVVLRAVTALGQLACGSSSEQLRLAVAKGLLGVVCSKGVSEEVLLAAGEAAALAAGDVAGCAPSALLWSNHDSVADCVDAAAGGSSSGSGAEAGSQPAKAGGGGAMDVDGAQRPSGSVGGAAGPEAVQAFLLQELSSRLAVSPKEEVRCAGCVLLVSLLQLCSGSRLIAGQLPQLQATFTGLLGDSNELTQDLAARGVSLVYSRGGEGLQQQLLSQLLGLLQGSGGPGAAPGAAGAAGVKLAPDSRLFEEGQLGNTPGGSGLTTYRELCSLANDLGQPDLIYRFMDLARASSALTAKRGAAVGVARIARLAAAAGGQQGGGGGSLAALLGPQRLASLLPKLYRLTHDPSPKVAESMAAIWAALLDDPRRELEVHFDAIAKSLLADVGARLWRTRQAACASLTDLLSGRRWAQLAPHMEQLWVMALRALDDVKESVRGAASGLLRGLRGTSLRLMDRQQTPAADVAGCCRIVLPLLAGSQGLGSSVDEVRGVAADVLVRCIKSAGPPALLPVLPAVVPVLLEALSGLEDARLNYVEQHAERVGIDADKLADARLAAARASSLSEALDAACRALNGEAAAELAPGLASLVRRGVGLNTKVGTGRFIKALATRLGPELRPAAPALLKPLLAAVPGEGSGAVKRAYAGAAAALVLRCCGDKRQERFVADAVASYGAVAVELQPFYPGRGPEPSGGDAGASAAGAAPMSGLEGGGGSQDDARRQAGGLLLRELLRESGDAFARHASQILPVAFVAAHDEASAVAAAWTPVWCEGCPSEPAALRLHAREMACLISGGLGSSSWPRKRAAAKALIVLSGTAGEQLAPFSPALARQLLVEGGEGRLWDGKEQLLAALGALCAACTATLVQQPGLEVLCTGLLAAAARNKIRAAALAALQQLLNALPGVSKASAQPSAPAPGTSLGAAGVWAVVSPPLLQALQQHGAAASQAPQPATANGSTTTPPAGGVSEAKPLPLVESCSCLASAWVLLPPEQQAPEARTVVEPLSRLLCAPGLPWATWLAVVALAVALIDSAAARGAGSATLVPLAAGLVHVLAHSTVSQLRVRCLEALLALLTALQADPSAAAAFAAAPAAPASGSASPSPAASLPGAVSACLAHVASQDPSAAHKALAGQAASVLALLAPGAA